MQHPYFVYPLLKELRESADPARKERLRLLIAANVSDRDALLGILGHLPEGLREFCDSESPKADATDATIDAFISKFGGASLQPPAPLLAEPAPEPSPMPESKSAPIPVPSHEAGSEPEPSPEELRTRVATLIKNREYEQALEIMEAFYLNNPKKSVYFADQIRFLNTLMANVGQKPKD
ncbi:MAG: hypothetical protein J1F07_07510 [Muribaculaceae bacterium]|nr:hypothetical protein [Muribaculaceae bacterium]